MTKSIGTEMMGKPKGHKATVLIVDEAMEVGQPFVPRPFEGPVIVNPKWMGEIEALSVFAGHRATFQPENVSVKTSPNPNRVRCPLCRRINTVTLVNAAADKKAANTFRCSYDGCRGYEWSQ